MTRAITGWTLIPPVPYRTHGKGWQYPLAIDSLTVSARAEMLTLVFPDWPRMN